MKKLILVSALLVSMSACVQQNVRQLTDINGKPIPGLLWHGLRQSSDLASWQFTSAITTDGKVTHFSTDRGDGLLSDVINAGGNVGAGYFIGNGLRHSGDVINGFSDGLNRTWMPHGD